MDGLPYRGDGTERPAGIPLPPARMPTWRAGRPLKRWRYAGIYGPDVMLCAGDVRIGGLAQQFWAVWNRRGARRLHERTSLRRGPVALPDGAVRVSDGAVRIDLRLEPAGEPVEVVSPHGRQYIWTRKQPVTARGRVTLGAREIVVVAAGLIDDSAGYHARRTAWEWCAGAGVARHGQPVVWNLVTGVHDARVGSERTVWIDGVAAEPGPVAFANDLSSVGDLRFHAEAERARHDELLVFASDYRQPFGTFTGTLPDGTALDEGFGVMERHRARW